MTPTPATVEHEIFSWMLAIVYVIIISVIIGLLIHEIVLWIKERHIYNEHDRRIQEQQTLDTHKKRSA